MKTQQTESITRFNNLLDNAPPAADAPVAPICANCGFTPDKDELTGTECISCGWPWPRDTTGYRREQFPAMAKALRKSATPRPHPCSDEANAPQWPNLEQQATASPRKEGAASHSPLFGALGRMAECDAQEVRALISERDQYKDLLQGVLELYPHLTEIAYVLGIAPKLKMAESGAEAVALSRMLTYKAHAEALAEAVQRFLRPPTGQPVSGSQVIRDYDNLHKALADWKAREA